MRFERKTLPDQHYLYVDRECGFDPKSISEAMASGFGEVFAVAQAKGIKPLAMPMSVYMEMPNDKLRFRAGVLVSADDAAKAGGAVKAGVMPAGDVLTTTHVGPYATLNRSHKALWDYAEREGLAKAMPVWEIFVDDPTKTPEIELRTEIFRALGR
ncbi:MAG: GyrI-like domain-containing protein [Amphiplicatus sp.]